jgi:hypothetical protein
MLGLPSLGKSGVEATLIPRAAAPPGTSPVGSPVGNRRVRLRYGGFRVTLTPLQEGGLSLLHRLLKKLQLTVRPAYCRFAERWFGRASRLS